MTGIAYRAPYTPTTHTEACATVIQMQRRAAQARELNPGATFVSDWTELDRDHAIGLISAGEHTECTRCAKIRSAREAASTTEPESSETATTTGTAQAISTVRSNYAALRRLATSGGRTAATTNAVNRRWNAIQATCKNLPRDLVGNLAYENALLENIAVSRRNGVERPELADRLADCRRRVRASA